MVALNTLWRSLLRHVVRPVPRNKGGRFDGLCESIKEHILHVRRKNEQAWQDALQEERRAKRRSLCLLLRLLTVEQRQEFRASRQFHVVGGSTGVRYRIRIDPFSNIDVLYSNGTVKYQLCVHPTGDVPVYDKMAAQLLYLQDPGTEMQLLRKANILPARAGNYLSSRALSS